MKLSEAPDWQYLLREFVGLYARGKAGGSARIRSHQRTVREAVGRVLAADPEIRWREPETKPVTAHLKRALDQGRKEVATESMIRAIANIAPHLTWLYGYEKVPRGLKGKYAYAEFAGPHGPVMAPDIILGIVLFAPKCTYPAHAHDGLTESYYTLSGAVSENDAGVYAPGSFILNPPGKVHRITVGDTEPSLLSYAWSGSVEDLADQKMTFTKGEAPEES